MELFILQDIEVIFPRPSNISITDGLFERESDDIETKISAAQKDDGADAAPYTKKLTSAIVQDLSVLRTKDYFLDLNVKVGISLYDCASVSPASPSEDDVPSQPPFYGTIRIHTDEHATDTSLTILHKMFKGDVSVNIYINQLGLKDDLTEHFSPINRKVTGLKIENGNVKGILAQSIDKKLLFAWVNYRDFSSRISVSVVLNCAALNLLDTLNINPESRLNHLKKMLEDSTCWDTEIMVGVGPDQISIKCHRAILATGSEVFQSMFESGMREATTNKLEMEGVSEKGVRALLAYLYYRDTTALHQSSEIALEILQAAEKYNIQGLRATVQEIMMAKEAAWFGLDTAITLYIFTKAICAKEEEIKDEDEDIEMQDINDVGDKDEIDIWNKLKNRSLRVLKWYNRKKPKTVLESVIYYEFFSGNPRLGIEISNTMLRLG